MFSSQTNAAATIESLETRKLFSAVTVPLALRGIYDGDAVFGGGSAAIKLVIAAKTQKLTVLHLGAATQTLTKAKIVALEGGTFAFSGSDKGEKLVFNGNLSSGVITGTFTGKGDEKVHGTFSLTQI